MTVKEYRAMFGLGEPPPMKCSRCGGAHRVSKCPIPPDYDVEKSASSPKHGSCCDPPKQSWQKQK